MSDSLAPVVYSLVSCVAVMVLALLVITFGVATTSRRLADHRTRVVKRWQAQGLRILLGPAHANFLNRPRSIGSGGNGTLLLSADALHFAQATPDREIVIPLKDIHVASLASQFNGRWGGGPFLVVQRKVGDLTGFQTEQAQRWVDAINAAISTLEADSRTVERGAPTPAAVLSSTTSSPALTA